MLSYSKGSRGLSVPLRVPGIFTGTTISPSSWLRQCPDRYTIRAGRNLPDKEFRYLRTVIVTAAVYRGFNSRLAPLLLTFRHRAGVRPYTSSCDFAESCVFDKQSPGPFLCGPACAGRPLFLSYRTNLPSSLAMDHSSTFGYSPRPPVSVSGTGGNYLKLRGFSWKSDYSHYPLVRRLTVLSGFSTIGGFACRSYTYALQRTIPSVRGSFTPPSPLRSTRWYWIINQLSIGVRLSAYP